MRLLSEPFFAHLSVNLSKIDFNNLTIMKNLKKVAFATIMFALWIALGVSCDTTEEEVRVLVFSKTAGYRHESIGAGIEAIRKLGAKQGFAVDTTENATQFNEENLVRYRAVIFLNTTGDIFN